jgi:hypothetical protein
MAQDVDGEDYEVIPGTELKVCRVATSDNQSLYYVNDKSSKFTEVAQLLTSKGIDLDHNRFLILQGEVELISLMPPVISRPLAAHCLDSFSKYPGAGDQCPTLHHPWMFLWTPANLEWNLSAHL